MYVLADLIRRPPREGPAVGDLLQRLARSLTVALDQEEGRRTDEDETGGQGLPLTSRVRIATFIALATALLFLPVEAGSVATDVVPSLLLLYGVHAALTCVVLIASFGAAGRRHADALGLLLVAGHAANLHAYLYLRPAYPGLTGGILTCLLVGSSILFSWSTWRVLVLSTAVCVAFGLVGRATIADDLLRPSFVVAWIALVVGAATAVGCARLLALLRASLAQREHELTDLSVRLMSAQEEERQRLSRELHDELGQSLTAVNAYLWLIEHHPPADVAGLRSRTAEARRVVASTLTAMRELSHLLRPSVLDDFGLLPSLESLLRAFGERHRVEASLTSDGLPERLPAALETALYRIVQEALTNVARHARARRVRVTLAACAGELQLGVEDDGVGLPERGTAAPPAGTGLIGIRERARTLGGHMTISSRGGACLSVRVPLPDDSR